MEEAVESQEKPQETSKALGGRKHNKMQSESIKRIILKGIMAAFNTNKIQSELKSMGFHISDRVYYDYRTQVYKENEKEFFTNKKELVIEAMLRKQYYVDFWRKHWVEDQAKLGYMKKAEQSENELNDLKLRTGVLPSEKTPIPTINIMQQNHTQITIEQAKQAYLEALNKRKNVINTQEKKE